MKKTTVFLLISAFAFVSAKADVLLSQDFEGLTGLSDNGWTVVVDDRAEADCWKLTSKSSAISGEASATAGGFHDLPATEQCLVSPDVTLGEDEYKLQFLWGGASAAYAISQSQYDFQVRVQVVGEDSWTRVFSFTNQADVEASGVKWPWTNWNTYQSTVDVSAFAGKTIRVAFVWLKFNDGYSGNTVKVDDITLESYVKPTGAIIESATSSYTFGATYIGTSSHSEVLRFKNVGVGNLEITGISGLEGTDFSTSIVPGTVSLPKNEEYQFAVHYTPTLAGKTEATMVIQTNGANNLEIALKGEKVAIPYGYTYEGFEGATFPPAGWSLEGTCWRSLDSSYSGDRCVLGTAAMEEYAALITPRLDLSEDKEHEFFFDFFDSYEQLVSSYPQPDNYFRVYLSTDGKASWTLLYENEEDFNSRIRKTLSLGNPKSDNCYIKFEYYLGDIESLMQTADVEFSQVYIDDVLLPTLYGSTSAPGAAALVAPADAATDIINREVALQWGETQFADKYTVFYGTSADNLGDGIDAGSATSYTLPRLDYSTTYFWKVVPSNAFGSADNVPVWSFTTMADQTVSEYPYFEGFEDSDEFPLGWRSIRDGYTKWSIAKTNPFDGARSVYGGGSVAGTQAVLESTEFAIPSDKNLQISFFWGLNAPVNLTRDDFGEGQNTSTQPDGIDAAYFDIFVDNEWHQLAILSQECQYWLRESFDLSPYKGKTVAFRWRYAISKSYSSRGISLDNVKIDDLSGCLAYFNTSEWNAGEVNNAQTVTAAGKFSLSNGGADDLTVASVATADPHYSTNIQVGATIQANKALPFDISFGGATEARTYPDALTVTFTNGQQVSLPLNATVLAADVAFYSFENDEFGSIAPKGFTVVDKDGYATYGSSVIKYPNRYAPYAFVVINVTPECADWRNVYPRSGNQVLAAMASPSGAVSDWIISPLMQATVDSRFRFFGKSYATDDEFNDFTPHYFSVLVSTTDTNPESFETVKAKTALAYSKEGAFTEYTVDLSKYAGQNVYVALQHTAETTAYVAFFDDFYYEHFKFGQGGLTRLTSERIVATPNPTTDVVRFTANDVEQIDIVSAAGALVRRVAGSNEVNVADLPAGIYFANVKTATSTTTVRFIKR